MQTGLNKSPNTVDANVKVVGGDVGDVPDQEGKALAALYQTAGVVRTQVSLQGQAVLGRGHRPAHDWLDLPFVTNLRRKIEVISLFYGPYS